MRLSEGLGKRQTKASPPLVFAAEVAVDLAEMAERLGNVVEPDAAARLGSLLHQEQAGPDGLGNVNGSLMNNPG